VNTDPRRWAAGTTTTIEQTVPVPAGLAPGSYQLGLALPDASPALATVPQYAIQTANTGLWNAADGYNDLQATVTIG
jgi:hypothetical protein